LSCICRAKLVLAADCKYNTFKSEEPFLIVILTTGPVMVQPALVFVIIIYIPCMLYSGQIKTIVCLLLLIINSDPNHKRRNANYGKTNLVGPVTEYFGLPKIYLSCFNMLSLIADQ